MNVFQCFIICKRTNNANNATHYVKLGKKRRESKRNYYIISPRVIIKAIIITISLQTPQVNRNWLVASNFYSEALRTRIEKFEIAVYT